MPQIDICNRGSKSNSPGIEAETEAAGERVIISFGHENSIETQVFGLLRPFDNSWKRAIRHDGKRERNLSHTY